MSNVIYKYPGRGKHRLVVRDVDVPNTRLTAISDGHLIWEGAGGIKRLSSREEWISYSTRPKSQRFLSNSCRHLIVDYTFGFSPISDDRNTLAAPTVHADAQGDTVENEFTGSGIGWAAAKAALGVNLQDYAITDPSTVMDSVYDSMRPDLTEVSVPNFIIEFAQISSLWKIWNTRRSFVPNVANKNLQYQYGFIPTIGDISGMISAIRNLQQKIRDWNRSVGRLRRRKRTVLSDTISKSGSSVVSNWGTVNWNVNFTRQITAHITYRPLPIQAMTNTERLLRGTLDSLGFELNPAILWDAIPFSFIVDWFLNIGGYLEGIKFDTLELPIKLEDAFLQNKEMMTIDCRTTNNGVPLEVPVSQYAGSRRTEKFFSRIGAFPHDAFARQLGWRIPTRNQAGLALSLVLGKWVK